MTVKFTAVERANPLDRNQKKYYATIRSSGDIIFNKIAERIAAMTALSRSDVKSSLDALIQVMVEELKEGNIIRFEKFGSFFLTLSGMGTPTAEELTSNAIQGVKLNFRPGKELKEAFKNLQLEKTK